VLLSIAHAAHARDDCSLRVPGPVLRPGAYPAQTLVRQDDHVSRESAVLRPGLRIEIRQDACEDFVTARFTLTASGAQAVTRTDEEWIDFARAELARLKLKDSPQRLAELDAFLGKARGIAARGGERTLCRDGTTPGSGTCSWDSLGGYTVTVKRRRGATTVSVTEALSA
jgi:hypothetical protein